MLDLLSHTASMDSRRSVRAGPETTRELEHEMSLIIAKAGQAFAQSGTDLESVPAIAPEIPPDPLAGPASVDDLVTLFEALTQRLRSKVDAGPNLPALGATPAASLPLTLTLEDCAGALERLGASIIARLRLTQRLESDLRQARQALLAARSELIGSRLSSRLANHQALHDSLTRLPNRRHFHQHLDQTFASALAHQQPLALFYLDLDGFKLVNDSHGHSIGDELLRIVGARLRGVIRAEDMVSRLGGDEFACVLTNIASRRRLRQTANMLFKSICAPFTIEGNTFRIRPSIGIATSPPETESALALLKHADAAMYHAKRHRTRIAFADQAAAA